ncbi:MAG: diguanylate cyclase, partial [Candidatus Melainabacteria bacterium]|nr:diguanylate cyclase [Candidatus Melainabacteria bacterium]
TRGPKVTVSVGCSFFNMEDLNPETILRDAKLALQQAKEGGRNQVAAQV